MFPMHICISGVFHIQIPHWRSHFWHMGKKKNIMTSLFTTWHKSFAELHYIVSFAFPLSIICTSHLISSHLVEIPVPYPGPVSSSCIASHPPRSNSAHSTLPFPPTPRNRTEPHIPWSGSSVDSKKVSEKRREESNRNRTSSKTRNTCPSRFFFMRHVSKGLVKAHKGAKQKRTSPSGPNRSTHSSIPLCVSPPGNTPCKCRRSRERERESRKVTKVTPKTPVARLTAHTGTPPVERTRKSGGSGSGGKL